MDMSYTGYMTRGRKGNAWQHRRSAVVYALITVLAALSLMASTGDMGAAERSVFDWIYGMPDSLRWFALVATQLGNFWLMIAVVGLLLVIKWNPRPSLLVLRGGVLAYGIVAVIKVVVSRPRPMILLSEVTSREITVVGSGFPSAHTALATVVSLTVLPYLPKQLRWVPVLWIGLVAWSRIYLGVHAPLDVAGGFIIGLLVILLADVIPWPPARKSSK